MELHSLNPPAAGANKSNCKPANFLLSVLFVIISLAIIVTVNGESFGATNPLIEPGIIGSKSWRNWMNISLAIDENSMESATIRVR